MKRLVAILVLATASCATSSSTSTSTAAPVSSRTAQTIVDSTAAKYADVARLSIHALHGGDTDMRILASTVAGRVGDPSDPEDLRVLQADAPIILYEGRNLDYTVAVQHDSGQRTMAIGVTISGTVSSNEATLLARAKEVATEVEGALRAAEKTGN